MVLGGRLLASEANGLVADRRRAKRVPMRYTGYRGTVNEQPVAIVDLSALGVQVRGQVRVRPRESVTLKLGWAMELPSTALGRVQWVQMETAMEPGEALYRIGLAFELWDVRLVKKIMQSCQELPVPSLEDR